MRVSVIVPLYNKEPFVTRALRSLCAQTFRDFEVIVVDDGSTDASFAVAQAFAASPEAQGTTIRIFSQVNAGPGRARNRAVSEAAGDWLAFLDADDEWSPEYLASNLLALDVEENRSPGLRLAAVVSGYVEFPSRVNREAMWRKRGVVEGVTRIGERGSAEPFAHLLAFHACGNTTVRASVFRDLGGFYERDRCLFGEDSWFWLQVLLRETVLVRFEPLTYIHREASELSGNYGGARPIEPFLLDPKPIEERCPPQLRGRLRGLLVFRALKTACMLGYWGEWRAADALRRRFASLRDVRHRYFWPALVCSTPLGGFLGEAWRALRPSRHSATLAEAEFQS